MSPYVRPAIVRSGDRLCARSVLLFLLGIFTATFAGLPMNASEELDFQTTRELARGPGLILGDTPESTALISRGDELLATAGGARSDRAVGAPLTSVPLYWIGSLVAVAFGDLETFHQESTDPTRTEYVEHLFVGWRNALLAAITAWLVALSARRIGAERQHAWLAGLTFALTTYVWPAARAGGPDVPAMFFLFLAFHFLLRTRERFVRLLRPLKRDLLGFGIASAMSVLVRPDLFGAALAIAGAFVVSILVGYRRLAQFALFLRKTWRVGHWSDMAIAALPVAGIGSVLFFTGATQPFLVMPSSDPVSDVLLELISPGRGLVWFAPLVLLAPVGFAVAHGRGARLWPLCALVVIAWTLWAGHDPHAGDEPWGFGPVRLLPALPVLWLAVSLAVDRIARTSRTRLLGHGLAVLGVLVNLSGVFVDTHGYENLFAQVHAELRIAGDAAELGDAAEILGPVESREFRESGDVASVEVDEYAFREAAWEPRFAQPWVHWRLLRHRLAIGDRGAIPAEEVFLAAVSPGASLAYGPGRLSGFDHLAWVDLRDRLNRRPFPAVLISVVLVAMGAILAIRGLDRALP